MRRMKDPIIRTIWKTASEQCELVWSQFNGYRVRLWVRGRLIVDELTGDADTGIRVEAGRVEVHLTDEQGQEMERLLVLRILGDATEEYSFALAELQQRDEFRNYMMRRA